MLFIVVHSYNVSYCLLSKNFFFLNLQSTQYTTSIK
jgi:hypothetical protein